VREVALLCLEPSFLVRRACPGVTHHDAGHRPLLRPI
jgi:hypothetical protein